MNLLEQISSRSAVSPFFFARVFLAAVGVIFLLGGILGWRWVWEPRRVLDSLEYYLSLRFGRKGRLAFWAVLSVAMLLLIFAWRGSPSGGKEYLFLLLLPFLWLMLLLDKKDPRKEKPPEGWRCPLKKFINRKFGETGSRVYSGLTGVLFLLFAWYL